MLFRTLTYTIMLEVNKIIPIYFKSSPFIFYDSINTLASSHQADSVTFLPPLLALAFMICFFSFVFFKFFFHACNLKSYFHFFYLLLSPTSPLLTKRLNLHGFLLGSFKSESLNLVTQNIFFLILVAESKATSISADCTY